MPGESAPNPPPSSAPEPPRLARVLLVEDEPLVRAAYVRGLGALGYDTLAVSGIGGARAAFLREGFDALLLDRSLPDGDGLDLCLELRRAGHTLPIIIVSGRAEEDDILPAFQRGADEYVHKPVTAAALAARLSALIRRARSVAAVTVGAFTIEPLRRELVIRSDHAAAPARIALSNTETSFLLAVARRANEIVPREEVLAACYGDAPPANENALDAVASRLRRKMRRYGQRLETVRGRGYRLHAEPRSKRPPRRKRRAGSS